MKKNVRKIGRYNDAWNKNWRYSSEYDCKYLYMLPALANSGHFSDSYYYTTSGGKIVRKSEYFFHTELITCQKE